jgi:hypothetical protein
MVLVCYSKRKKNASGVILITKDLVTQTRRNTVSGINLGVSIGCTVPSPLFVPVVLPLLYIRNNMQGGWNCENNNISVICDIYSIAVTHVVMPSTKRMPFT